MRWISAIIILLITPVSLFANNVPEQAFGNQVGNGGKGVICRDQKGEVTTVRLLDFYEAELLGRGKPEFVGATYLEMAAFALERLKARDLQKFILYKKELDDFGNQSKWVHGPISETEDSEHVVAPPPGCKFEQLAIQIPPGLPNDRRYNFNFDFWQKMSEVDRAGLVLHEIIYREAIARGHKNSIAVRYLNALISSNNISHMSQKEFHGFLHAAHLSTIRWTQGRTWSLIDGVEMNWKMAKKACEFMEYSHLATVPEILGVESALRSSGIMSRIIEDEIPEVWTLDRDQESGKIHVANWQESSVHFFFRPINATAQVLCLTSN